MFYGIGFGPVTPAAVDGQVTAQLTQVQSNFQIYFDSGPPQLATPTAYAGLALGSLGLYQFSVVVPANIVPAGSGAGFVNVVWSRDFDRYRDDRTGGGSPGAFDGCIAGHGSADRRAGMPENVPDQSTDRTPLSDGGRANNGYGSYLPKTMSSIKKSLAGSSRKAVIPSLRFRTERKFSRPSSGSFSMWC